MVRCELSSNAYSPFDKSFIFSLHIEAKTNLNSLRMQLQEMRLLIAKLVLIISMMCILHIVNGRFFFLFFFVSLWKGMN